MIRSLWTAASGMKSQQTNVDTISNNLANASTTGYKKETAEFKSLLYQTLQAETTTADASTDASKKIGGASASSYVKNLIKNDPKLSDKAKTTILGKLNS